MAKKEIPITIEMPMKLLDKWLKALRSGKYKQGKGTLEDEGKFCCLGVLQKIANGETEADCDLPSMHWLRQHGIRFTNEDGYLGCSPLLPTLGVSASVANDGNSVIQKHKFTTIANAIEKCAKGV